MSVIKTAVIGCGISGPEIHMPIISAHPKAELVAICDTDKTRLDAASNKFPQPETYTDHTEIIETENVDSVHLCIPPRFSRSLVEDFVPNGIPVLLEKPGATTTEDVRRMQELSEKHDTPVSVVHNRLFEPQIREAISRVRNGAIGDVVSVHYSYSENQELTETPRNHWVFDLPGGELGEGLVHQVYIPLAFTGQLHEIQSVSVQNYAEYEETVSIDGVTISGIDTHSRDINIQITASGSNGSVLHILGTDGELLAPGNVFGSYVLQDRNKYINSINLATDIAVKVLQKAASAISSQGSHFFDKQKNSMSPGHKYQIDKHPKSIQNSSEPPVPLTSLYETVKILEMVDDQKS